MLIYKRSGLLAMKLSEGINLDELINDISLLERENDVVSSTAVTMPLSSYIYENRNLCENDNYTLIYVLNEQSENELVGFAFIRNDESTKNSDFIKFIVDHKYRHRGYGTFLLEALLTSTPLLDFTQVDILVLKENKGAIKFYETMDFEIDDVSCGDKNYVSMVRLGNKEVRKRYKEIRESFDKYKEDIVECRSSIVKHLPTLKNDLLEVSELIESCSKQIGMAIDHVDELAVDIQ